MSPDVKASLARAIARLVERHRDEWRQMLAACRALDRRGCNHWAAQASRTENAWVTLLLFAGLPPPGKSLARVSREALRHEERRG